MSRHSDPTKISSGMTGPKCGFNRLTQQVGEIAVRATTPRIACVLSDVPTFDSVPVYRPSGDGPGPEPPDPESGVPAMAALIVALLERASGSE